MLASPLTDVKSRECRQTGHGALYFAIISVYCIHLIWTLYVPGRFVQLGFLLFHSFMFCVVWLFCHTALVGWVDDWYLHTWCSGQTRRSKKLVPGHGWDVNTTTNAYLSAVPQRLAAATRQSSQPLGCATRYKWLLVLCWRSLTTRTAAV